MGGATHGLESVYMQDPLPTKGLSALALGRVTADKEEFGRMLPGSLLAFPRAGTPGDAAGLGPAPCDPAANARRAALPPHPTRRHADLKPPTHVKKTAPMKHRIIRPPTPKSAPGGWRTPCALASSATSASSEPNGDCSYIALDSALYDNGPLIQIG